MSPLDRFARILADELGYATPPQNRPRIERVLHERASAAAGGDAERYLALLGGDDERARAEWQAVLRELTIGESFFFRDGPQFRLLRETILPRLLERRADQRSLRVWSAGCSTGEEPYSLAILLSDVLPPGESWDVSIVGTDVNEASLEQARRGLYSAWSLRGLPDEEQERRFTRERGQFRLRPEYRRMVSFRRSNLVRDRIPSYASGLHGMDLVLCRNVFIYFEPETRRRVAEKLAHALAPGGFLLTGHADLQGQGPSSLRTHVLPGSVVYERPPFEVPAARAHAQGGASADPSSAVPPPSASSSGLSSDLSSGASSRASRPAPAPAPAPAPVPPAAAPASMKAGVHADADVEEAEAAFRQAEYDRALGAIEARLARRPEDAEALRLAAVAAANLGQHARSARYCRRLLDLRPKDVEARYLLAKLAQEREAEDEARELLERVLADAPAFVPALLDLAWLARRRGDVARAEALREEARGLLERLPRQTILSEYEGLTAEDLLAQIRPSREADGEGGGGGEA